MWSLIEKKKPKSCISFKAYKKNAQPITHIASKSMFPYL